MKKITFHRALVIIGLLLWIAETAYFGWNKTPVNGIERMADTIAWLFILWGLFGDITSNIKIEKSENVSITTPKVEIIDKRRKE